MIHIMLSRRFLQLSVFACLILASAPIVPARQAPSLDPSLVSEMRWRGIGPHRGGRTRSAAGAASQPYTFYIGVCNGGVCGQDRERGDGRFSV